MITQERTQEEKDIRGELQVISSATWWKDHTAKDLFYEIHRKIDLYEHFLYDDFVTFGRDI